MRHRIVALLALGLTPVPGAAGQLDCPAGGLAVVAQRPDLTGYELLFQQNGVAFYALLPEEQHSAQARLAVLNSGTRGVEVSYSVQVGMAPQGGPEIALGRHCARIGSGQYAVAPLAAPARAASVRVRNLTIASLSDPPPADPPGAAQARVPAPTAPVAAAAAPPQVATTGRQPPTPSEARGTPEAHEAAAAQELALASGDADTSHQPEGIGGAARAVITGLRWISAVALGMAGVGLVLPVLAGLGLVLTAGAAAAWRTLRPGGRQ